MNTAQSQVSVETLFATPVATARHPRADTINPAIAEIVLVREAAVPSTQHSNLLGWQSAWDFPEWGGPAGEDLLNFARAVATRLIVDRQGQPVEVDWRMNAWANINRRGHGNEFHTHPGCVWSDAYYVDDGGTAADPALGGEFEIADPRGAMPAMYRPDLVPAIPGGASAGASTLLGPQAGMMILFPAWLSHAVRPYLGDGQRISIAFNLST